MGSIDDVDLDGIEPRFTAQVPDEAQCRLASAIPECRLVWNNAASVFQVVYREPHLAQQLDDGYLRGWQIVATFEPPLDVEAVIAAMRKREEFIAWKLGQMGYHGETNRDVIEAYLDDADAVLEKASDDLHEAVCDDYFNGPLARVRDEVGIHRKFMERTLDETKRVTSHRRIVVPVKRGSP